MKKPYEKPRLDKRGILQAFTAQSAVSSRRDSTDTDDGNEDGNDGAGGIT